MHEHSLRPQNHRLGEIVDLETGTISTASLQAVKVEDRLLRTWVLTFRLSASVNA